MDSLDFYLVDPAYVRFLQNAETRQRGFSRVPNMTYAADRKPKFLCGVVLRIHEVNYYVPVSSYKQQRPDNFLIYASNGKVVSSLRFNYMFPVPDGLVTRRIIKDEPDTAYRYLLSQERRFCIRNQETIQRLAQRTYERVLSGKDPVLVTNSCDFRLLEETCRQYGIRKNRAPQPAL